MNTTINQGMPKLPQAPASQGNGAPQGTADATGTGASGAAASNDHVNLTESARALQEASRADAATAIDSPRVEKVRQAIADGSYQINPARIAERMLQMDAQMSGTAAVDKG